MEPSVEPRGDRRVGGKHLRPLHAAVQYFETKLAGDGAAQPHALLVVRKSPSSSGSMRARREVFASWPPVSRKSTHAQTSRLTRCAKAALMLEKSSSVGGELARVLDLFPISCEDGRNVPARGPYDRCSHRGRARPLVRAAAGGAANAMRLFPTKCAQRWLVPIQSAQVMGSKAANAYFARMDNPPVAKPGGGLAAVQIVDRGAGRALLRGQASVRSHDTEP